MLALAGMDVSRMRSGVLAQAVREGDASVEAIVRGAARWLGAAVGMCVNVMGPDMVVLGGGLVEAMPVLFCEEVDAEARRQDPRVKEVVISMAGVHEVMMVAVSDGTLSADVRPLIRFNVVPNTCIRGASDTGIACRQRWMT